MKDAQSVLEEFASRAGWNTHSMLEIACRYIDNQMTEAAFRDFVSEACGDENPSEEDPPEYDRP